MIFSQLTISGFIFITIFVKFCKSAEMIQNILKFREIHELKNKTSSNGNLWSKTVRSLVHCSDTCATDTDCTSMFYNSVENICSGSDIVYSSTLDLTSYHGNRYYLCLDRSSSAAIVQSQWVSEVLAFSSEYSAGSWSAAKVIGAFNVYPNYGDLADAWAPKTLDNQQFLELKYSEAVYITSVDIYETYHCGGVTAVKVLDPAGQWVTMWSTPTAQVITSARVFSPVLQKPNFMSDTIRVEVDCSVSASWVEIDAVRLNGTRVYVSY